MPLKLISYHITLLKTFKIVFLILIALNFGHSLGRAETEFSIPNNGSPYRSIGDLEIGQILHIPTGVIVNFDQMMDTVSSSRVIYIGETHDNIEAHRIQLKVLNAINQRYPGKIALGMEMFRQSAQPQLDEWSTGKLKDKNFRRLFRENWGSGFQLYAPIFDFARQNHIPLLGLKSSKETEQRFREEGLNLPNLPTLDTNDIYHKAYSMSLFGGNSTHKEVVSKPYQMLVLWEEAMGKRVAQFLSNEKYKDWKLVVLAGGFHVQYGYGIPKRAFRRFPHAYSIILPTVTEIPENLKDREMKFEKVSTPLYIADFGWKVEYRVPPPKKIRLGIHLKEKDDGLLILSVQPESSAENMGLKKNDLILKLENHLIIDVEDLSNKLQQHKFGDIIELEIKRDGETKQIQGTLKEIKNQKK